MSDFEVHRAGDRFVISADISSFHVLLSLARQTHRPHLEDGDRPSSLIELAETLGRVSAQLPSRPSYSNMNEAITARDIPGVDFVNYTAHVVLGVDRALFQRIEDCLAVVVREGDDADLHTLTGAWFPEIRAMYLTAAGANGHFRSARRICFPEGRTAGDDLAEAGG
jgi:hypothetical protein